MANWIITGASGSMGSALIDELLKKGKSLTCYSRSEIQDERINFKKVEGYDDLEFEFQVCEGLIIVQGFFHFEEIKNLDSQNLENIIEANFVSQIQVVKNFLKHADERDRTDVVILGSTSAFHAGRGTTVYGAAKAGMLGFVRALNEEYKDTDIRFWFVSTGTLSNEMGAKVPNQDPSSLLDPKLIAKRIVDAVTSDTNLWEPEITIRRRHIKLVD